MHELRKDPLLSRWVAVMSNSKSPEEYTIHPENSGKPHASCAQAGRRRPAGDCGYEGGK